MYKAIEIAKYVVSKCCKDDCPISNLQLQKILYFIQMTNLQKYKCPLFSDLIEAWQFGPVIPEVYYHYCGYGAMKITSIENSSFSEKDSCIVDNIVEEKRILDPWDLVNATHKTGGAWDIIYNHGKGNRNVIPNNLIESKG